MSALLLIDIQNDFLPGGALGVPGGDQILPVVEEYCDSASHIIASQDFHPKRHASFASTHGKEVGEVIEWKGVSQVLWPDHCVQGESGSNLLFSDVDHIVQKGTDSDVDSYSAFFDNARLRSTGLHEYLQQKGISELTLMGLATDYCVKFTALDAAQLGYRVRVIREGCRAVNLSPDDEERALVQMASKGILFS